MKELFNCRCWLRGAVMLVGPLLLISIGTTVWAESAGENLTPSLLPSSGQEDQSVLNRRLQTAKTDLEVFLVFVEHFRDSGETKTVVQIQGPIDDYVKRHVDKLLEQAAENATVEVIRPSAEIMLSKVRLYVILNRAGESQATLAEMKKRFAPYLKITVQLGGKTTTLDEAIRQLDEDIKKTTTIKKI